MLFTNTILLLLFLSTVRATPSCNVGLIVNNSAIEVMLPNPVSPIPVLGYQSYWQLVGDYGIVKLRFPSTYYFTGLGIQVNTVATPPCNFVESSIDLRDYELILDDRRVNIPIRNSNGRFNNTFIRASFPPVRASSVEIVKASPNENLSRYCIQYQLYGCATSPTDCDTLLSYDLTPPNVEDNTYTGTCNDGWCSGGVGILHDGKYDKSLSWNGSTDFRLAFYQSVGVKDITIFFSPSTDPITSTPMFNLFNRNEMTLQINKVIDFYSFRLNSSGRFSVLEITVNYWPTQKNQITIPCSVSDCSFVALSPATQFIIPISTSFVGLVIGIIATLVVLRLVRNKKIKFPIAKKQVKQFDNNLGKKTNEYSVHEYTDVHSNTSVTALKQPSNINLDELGRSELNQERYTSIDSARNSTVGLDSTDDDAINRDNSIYGKGDNTEISNGGKVETIRSGRSTLQKNESEIEYQENNKYDSFAKKEQFRIESVPELNESLDDYSHLKH